LFHFLPAAVALDLSQEIVEEIEEIGIFLADGPGERFVVKGLENAETAFALLGGKQ
jgi:hypothetical protein